MKNFVVKCILVALVVGLTFPVINAGAATAALEVELIAWTPTTYMNEYLARAQRIVDRELPGVKINFVQPAGNYAEYVINRVLGRKSPDIVWVGLRTDFYGMIAAGILQPLTPYIAKDTRFQIQDFIPTLVQSATVGGNIWAIPAVVGPYALVYNKNLFDERGVAYPDDTWTMFDTFAKALSKLQADKSGDGVVDQWGWLLETAWTNRVANYIAANGGKILSGDQTRALIHQKESVEMFDFLANLVQQGLALAGNVNVFLEGKAATHVGGFFHQGDRYMVSLADSWHLAPLPSARAGRLTTINSNGWAIPTGAPDYELSWKVIEILSRPEVQAATMEILWQLPANRRTLTGPNFLKAKPAHLSEQEWFVWARASENLVPVINHPKADQFDSIIQKQWDLVRNGKAPAAVAMLSASEQIDALLK